CGHSIFLLSLFILPRLPPSPTLFPYTTLFRSHHAAAVPEQQHGAQRGHRLGQRARERAQPLGPHELLVVGAGERAEPAALEVLRSEEHTSELQSRENLVCRLLLEKKKKHDSIQ